MRAPRPRRLICVYGSVTGKAESIAQQIVDTAPRKGFQVPIMGAWVSV